MKTEKSSTHHNKITYVILFQHNMSIQGMALFEKSICCIRASMFEHDLIATWMIFIKISQIIHLVIYDHPAWFDGAMSCYLFIIEQFRLDDRWRPRKLSGDSLFFAYFILVSMWYFYLCINDLLINSIFVWLLSLLLDWE